MKIILFLIAFSVVIFIFYLFTHKTAGNDTGQSNKAQGVEKGINHDSLVDNEQLPQLEDSIPVLEVNTRRVTADSLVSYAESFIGTPYKYASADPSTGFDCSGFIAYVFNHYNIKVPRSAKDFENIGLGIPVNKCKRGDVILFTGTDSTERIIGHIGIVVSNNNDSLRFIHSTSGKAYGVVITDFNEYYESRFVKVIRVFWP